MKKRKWMVGTLLFVLCAAAWVIFPKILEIQINQRLDLVEVVCAARDLPRRTVLKESDLTTILIPSAYVNDSAFVTKEEVIGKVSVHQGFIPKGSLLYVSALENLSEISDAAILGLKDDQVLYALETNVVALAANALVPEQIVDVYVTMEDERKESVTGLLLEHVRIVGIKDHKGLDLTHPDSTAFPHVIQFAISKEALPVIQKAAHAGEISYYASGSSYTDDLNECTVAWDGEIIRLLGMGKEKAIEG